MLIEILFYGRGGQGGVTAANILVGAALKQGLYGQGFPFFGAERRGAPVKAFARISDKPILRHGMFNDADVLVILDQGLIESGIAKGIPVRNKGYIIANVRDEALIDPKNFSLKGEAKVFVVDATSIAIKNKLIVAGWPVVNTSMLGAFAKALNVISIDNVVEAIKEYFGDRIGEANAKAAYDAYNETKFFGEIRVR